MAATALLRMHDSLYRDIRHHLRSNCHNVRAHYRSITVVPIIVQVSTA